MSRPALESWPLNEPSAKVLGLPAAALTPTARLVANRTEGLWFDPAERLTIGRGLDGPHGLPAASLAEALAEALARRQRQAVRPVLMTPIFFVGRGGKTECSSC